jgi:hypothetical protein
MHFALLSDPFISGPENPHDWRLHLTCDVSRTCGQTLPMRFVKDFTRKSDLQNGQFPSGVVIVLPLQI